MRVRRTMAALLGAVLAMGMLGASAAAVTVPRGYGPHDGRVGYHWILDNPGPAPELPAATCDYGGSSLRLKQVHVRQPVLLANRAAGFKQQVVGWRAVLQSTDNPDGTWVDETATGWTKKTAVAPYPVDLAPKLLAAPSGPLTHSYYRVAVQMRWYKGNGSVDGRATHYVTSYRVNSEMGPFDYDLACPPSLISLTSSRSAAAPAAEPPFNGELAHSGKRGPHWILDTPGPEPELPAVICHYNAASTLQSVEVRRPIVLARDTGAGIQSQDVAWRFVLQGSLTDSGSESWSDVSQTTWKRARASETSWARFDPRTLAVAAPVGTYVVRVVIQLRWYKGTTNTVIGSASHTPLTYGREWPTVSNWEINHCLVQEA